MTGWHKVLLPVRFTFIIRVYSPFPCAATKKDCQFFKRQSLLRLFQFYNRYTAFALAVTAKTEAFYHAVAAQMLMDGGAQRTGAVAMDQIDHRLPVQDCAVNKGIHLRQRLIHRKPQQVALHFCGALYALYPAVGAVCITGQAGVPLLRFGLGRGGLFYQFFRLLQALERHLGLDDTGTHQHIAVFVRQRQNGGQLVQFCNADLLPYLYLLQRHKLLDGVMHHLRTGKQLLGLLFGNLAGALCLLLGAHALVLLQLAQFVGQRVGLCFHLLCQCTCLGTGGKLADPLYPAKAR